MSCIGERDETAQAHSLVILNLGTVFAEGIFLSHYPFCSSHFSIKCLPIRILSSTI